MNMHRAVFLSDVHLGSTHCHASELASFLSGLRCQRRLGLRYGSLADFLKRTSSAAEHYIERFVRAGLDDARRRGLDGIICGHIHRADLRVVDGLVYANDGDWVESLSVLAEDSEGNLKLLGHTGLELACLSRRLPPLQRIAEAA